jgi:ubiquinone/menaquinone biosynthesis C-methylase UbiE
MGVFRLSNKESNQIYYNKVSVDYDKKHLISMKDYPLFYRQMKYLFKSRELPQDSYVLDCGCGTGRGALKYCKMGCRVMAVDISPDIVGICASNAEREGFKIETRVENCSNLSFDNETFDYVTLSAALHHMENLELCISELFRVTKKGGALILIAEPKHTLIRPKWMREKKECLSGKYDREILKVEAMSENPDVHIFKLPELRDKLTIAGYSNIRVQCFYCLSSIYRDLLFFRLKNQKLRTTMLQVFSWIDTRLLFWLPSQCNALFNLIAWKE